MKLEKSNYNFKPVEFSCDNILSNKIKAPFPNRSFFLCIVGRPGSGKTSLLINCLTGKKSNRVYYKAFDKILYVCPINSRKSIKNNPFDDLPEDQKFEKIDDTVVKKILQIRDEFEENREVEKINDIIKPNMLTPEPIIKIDKPKKKKNRNQLLILDDVTAYLKDDPRILIELSTNRRHLSLSIILLVQFLRSVPKSVRFQITDIVVFKPSNELDTKIIEEEYINLPKNHFKELKRFVWNDKHDFLFINKDNDTYFKNLQKITFDQSNVI